MLDLITENEWLINLVSLSVFSASFLIPDYNRANRKAFLGILMVFSYSVLLLSVFINGLIKGF